MYTLNFILTTFINHIQQIILQFTSKHKKNYFMMTIWGTANFPHVKILLFEINIHTLKSSINFVGDISEYIHSPLYVLNFMLISSRKVS